MMSPTMSAYLPIMADFVPFGLTFMRPNKHLQLVSIKNLGGNIWSKIAAPSSTCVWVTASFASGIDQTKTNKHLIWVVERGWMEGNRNEEIWA